jgi:hypothetical protein
MNCGALGRRFFLILPQRDSAIQPISVATALAASAPNTLFMLPGEIFAGPAVLGIYIGSATAF